MEEKFYADACKRIWKGYKLYASGCGTARKGFECGGQTQPTDENPCSVDRFVYRGESILEHQAKVAWLFTTFLSNFSDNFGAMYPRLISGLWQYFAVAALTHDAGESTIGDIPDDGRAEHDTKDGLELDFYNEFVEAYHPRHQGKILDAFVQFQDKSSIPGQLVYALDKTDFVLTALFLEKHGHHGCIKFKSFPTDRDRYFMQVTETSVAADCWAAHLVTILSELPSTIRGPIMVLIDTAVRDVRGEPFKWWNKEILPYAS